MIAQPLTVRQRLVARILTGAHRITPRDIGRGNQGFAKFARMAGMRLVGLGKDAYWLTSGESTTWALAQGVPAKAPAPGSKRFYTDEQKAQRALLAKIRSARKAGLLPAATKVSP